ncbi:MAG TPA: TonB-dependent receptor [Spirochaetia bacterium]
MPDEGRQGTPDPVKAESTKTESPYVLDLITVTGTKTPEEITQTPVQTQVIDKKEIEQSGSDTLGDVLASAGLQFAENGMGSYTALQGMSGDRVLFLIDGRRVTGRVSNNLVESQIPAGSIERIEVIRGPQSALYGSDALGGVINIITKKPSDRASIDFSIENESLLPTPDGASPAWKAILRGQTLSSTVNVPIGPVFNKLFVSANQSFPYLDSQGISLYPDYLQGEADLDSQASPTDSTHLSWGGNYSFNREDIHTSSGGSLDRIDTQRGGAYVTGKWTVDAAQDASATVYYNHFERSKQQYTSLLDLWGGNGDESEDYVGADLQYNRSFGENNEACLAASYAFDTAQKYDVQNSATESRHTVSLVVQDEQFEENVYSVVGGLRGEYSTDYGWFFTPKISSMIYLADGLRILPSIAVGYRAPNFLELYLDSAKDVYHKYGNPDLQPEKSVGGNLGFEWRIDAMTLQVNAFHSELWDEIVYDYTDQYDEVGRQIIVKENLARSANTGADLDWSVAFLGFLEARLVYSYLFAWDWTEGTERHDVPSHTGSLRLTSDGEKIGLRAYVEAVYQGTFVNRVTPLVLLNCYLSKTLGDSLEASFGVHNITGAKDAFSSYLAGPVISIGLRGRF